MVQRKDRSVMLLAIILIISVFADTTFGMLCNKVDYKGYNRRCCQQTLVNTYDSSALQPACNSGLPIDPKLPAMYMDYTMNKYQNCKNDYKVDWNNSKVVEELGPAVCFGDCGFNFLHLLNSDGSMNDVALGVAFTALVPLPWKAIVLESITKCKDPLLLLKDVKLTMVDALTGASKTCAVTPYVYVQCVMAYAIGRCPVPIQVSSPPATCADDIAKIDKCTSIFNLPALSG